MKKDFSNLTAIGWREWISFPEWGVKYMKVKVDTGARTSSLHVGEIEYFEKDSAPWVKFNVYPWQKSLNDRKSVTASIKDFRTVKSSSGCQQRRPVIMARIQLAGHTFSTELTLTNRSSMGFRMLMGRAAMRKNFIVIPGTSYLGFKPEQEIRNRNKAHQK